MTDAQDITTTFPVHQSHSAVLILDAQERAFDALDAMAPERRAHLAQGLLLTLQAHRHRLTTLDTTLHQDAALARLLHLVNFWRLVLDIARIEQDRAACASPVSLERDIDADLLALLGRNARAIAATIEATTFAHLSGLDVMLPARAPIAPPLH